MQSGVQGISGVSSDFRDLEAAQAEGNERAALALDMFVESVRKFIGSYMVKMGGVDAIIFTAGIGENTPVMRADILKNTEFMGIKLDEAKNNAAIRGAQGEISAADSKVKVFVIPTNEELMIALDTERLLNK